jgi:pyrimidine-specific ribonucleoside hydrolase
MSNNITLTSFIVSFAAVLSACMPATGLQAETGALSTASPVTGSHAPSLTRQVIIDTDMAIDDWFAILYLLQKTDVSVLAITVAGTGEAHCGPGVKNGAGLVALAGHEPIPVACGVETPLRGKNTFPDGWRSWVDSVSGIRLKSGKNPNTAANAVDLLIATLEQAQEPVDLLTLGPLTNVAGLLTARPDLCSKIRGIITMGGAVKVPGNLLDQVPGNTAAEWNIFVDPYAANVVFRSGIPVTLVSLDATNQVPLNMGFFQRVKDSAATAEAKFVAQVLEKNQGMLESGSWYFWDPMAATILVDESLAEYEMLPIQVVEDSGSQQGATIISSGAPGIRVAVSADGDRCKEEFLKTIRGNSLLNLMPGR